MLSVPKFGGCQQPYGDDLIHWWEDAVNMATVQLLMFSVEQLVTLT